MTQQQQQGPAFRKGGQAAQEAAAAQSGSRFHRTPYLSIEENEQEVLRYITDSDDWVYVLQHANVPTKNKPEGYTGNWPQSMPAVCRYDEAFKGIYSDCYIDDAGLQNNWGRPCKPTIRVWALACLREEVIGDKKMFKAGEIEESQIGKRLGYRDQMRDVDERNDKGEPTGKTTQERAIVLVNFAPNNYFNALNSIYSIYGTVCDRDYVVKRTGEGKDANYDHIGYDMTQNLHPAFERDGKHFEETDSWARYGQALKEQNIDLGSIIAERASDDFYARFFDPTKTPEPRGGDKASGSSAPAQAKEPVVPSPADNDVDPEKLAAMRARVRGRSPEAASSEEETVSAPSGGGIADID
jgi:hypothetical protein